MLGSLFHLPESEGFLYPPDFDSCQWPNTDMASFFATHSQASWTLGPKLGLNFLLKPWCFPSSGKGLLSCSLRIGKLGPKGGAFDHLASLPFGVNNAVSFKDLCLLRLVLDHTLLGFIIVSVGLRHMTFSYYGKFGLQREFSGDAAAQLVKKKPKPKTTYLYVYFICEIIICVINLVKSL